MEIVRHPQTNFSWKAPQGQEADVAELPVIQTEDALGLVQYSFWKPDAHDLALLNAGHAVALGIHLEIHPVVSVGISKDPV
jgi:hypothetical protein